MARKLKTYQTSLGFFEQVIAAPSMKAALEAWGARSNLFHQGIAKEADDPAIIAASMAKPGVVLKRPVGSDCPFGEHSELPKNLDRGERRKPAPESSNRKAKKSSVQPDKAADRRAAQAFERERQQRERDKAREEAARQKALERRQRAVDKAQQALEEAEQEHGIRADALRAEIEAIEIKLKSEEAAWDREERRLKAIVQHARE